MDQEKTNPATEEQDKNLRDKQEDELLTTRTDKELEEAEKGADKKPSMNQP